MPRSFEAFDLVQLPRLNVAAAIALGTELATCANAAGKLPSAIAKSFTKLDIAHSALRSAAVGRLPDPKLLESPAARKADRILDAAWSATFDWCSGWTKLPLPANAEKVAIAQSLMVALFSEGLKFTQLPFKLEWAESQTRLDLVEHDKLGAKFTALGGDTFLKTIRTAHKAYGEALGLTVAKKADATLPSLRDPLEAFAETLRAYVVRVSAHSDPDEPESVALSKSLLEPVTNWTSNPQRTPGEASLPQAPDAGGAPNAADEKANDPKNG